MNLAPEIQKMRDAILERIKGKSLSEVAEIVNEVLLNETNNINRLAALSARVQILRDFTKKEFNLNKGNSFLNKDSALFPFTKTLSIFDLFIKGEID